MEIREIIHIKIIGDFGNLTRAAEHLNITQPSLSQSLKNIESGLGFELFTRTKRGMILTVYGKRFIKDASPLLSAYQDFSDKIEHYDDTGVTRLIGLYKLSYTTPINNAVMKFISQYHDDNYMIKVESISNLEKMILQGKLDVAIIKYTPIHNRNNNFSYDTLFKERLYVLLNKDHPLASRTSIHLAELEGDNLITSDPKEYPYKMTEEILSNAGIKLNIHTHTNYVNLSMIFDLVGQGLGVTFASEYVCNYFSREDVIKVPLEEIYDYEVCVVQKKTDIKNEQLLNFIKETLRNTLTN